MPKSFLAVNLSESHTFHKKEDVDEGVSTIAEMEAKKDEQKIVEASVGETTTGVEPPANVTSADFVDGAPVTTNDEETQPLDPKSE